ncbi:GCN5-related N-acetyltransferase [Paenibacillus curdlanolyticus YK9]|uniref:GCN5-related N-acetyltransferase n=1 Tax=Paenibacillus curdlanolyticus YK9 TaxID=717606 RepID=E0I5N4_9BACL|nr:GNAT family N-acetyltransferase [Paenibacillus curdlanolyticus]EFM12276.1 GCN5-related N-acetyltransferase [Paenibacillus curdlanolyticus YK9]
MIHQFDVTRFNEAIIYDANLPWQTDLAMVAKQNGEIVGVAGASKTCAKMWQIGVEILPSFRNFGLASYLVNRLTLEILERGDIPSYDVNASNIASQKVAYRVGYFPAWVTDWRCNFEGLEL